MLSKDLNNVAKFFGTSPVSHQAGQATLFCPSAITIHNNSNVLRWIIYPSQHLSTLDLPRIT